MLTFALANWRILAGIGLALTLLTALTAFGTHEFHRGAETVREADRKAVARAEVKATKVTTQLAQSATKAGEAAVQERVRIETRTQTLIQRVPYEIPSASDVRLPAGFLRLYNASLGLPEGGGSTEGAADQPGLQASDAVGPIARNNAECLKGWDAYQRVVTLYDETQAAVNGFRP